jgi:hypothetical protein
MLVHLPRICLQAHEDVFIFNLLKKVYKFCTLSMIYKDNTEINCIFLRRRRVSFQSTSTGHTIAY